ncbi:hypothetical protein [Corynebacterium mastitidis]|uniref:hypothetical protein n=1 Tax=Corynebacterium mastitidis TaxID=161890 RepID=UPI00037D3735|nr:hypothetical protein [Corynebacterium mastitidis]
MSNPTFSLGDLTRKAGKPVEKFRLVKEHEGKIEHAGAEDFPFGVVTESAAPKGDPEANVLTHGLPENVRVGTTQRVVKITTDEEISAGVVVYAAADGKVASSGSVKVGVADQASRDGLVRVHLFHPSVLV